MAFHVGQKVVCIDTDCVVASKTPVFNFLTKGTIYKIRWIGPNPYEPWRHFGICVRLEEIERSEPGWPDYPFLLRRFRPVIERKTDISVFEKIRDDASKKLMLAHD